MFQQKVSVFAKVLVSQIILEQLLAAFLSSHVSVSVLHVKF